MFISHHTKKAVSFKKGFTLVELLVTITIFVMVTGLVLVKYKNFNSIVLLNNRAYNVALTIREAQSYGINIKSDGSGSTNAYDHAYGVHFDTAQPTKFILFVDTNDNSQYDSSASPAETLNIYDLKNGNSIASLCRGAGSGAPPACSNTTWFDVVFKRPSPAAKITGGSNYAKVTLQSMDGGTRSVVVWKTGQISVE